MDRAARGAIEDPGASAEGDSGEMGGIGSGGAAGEGPGAGLGTPRSPAPDAR